MKKYNIINNVVGWVVFAIAAFTYCSTIEPTASFWDCPEFITTAYKLEVGHPPGAPFFMLFGNFFSLFASDASQVAKMINTMSALLSAGCILFLFWSVTHLAKKLLVKDDAEPTMGQLLAVMGSGIAGALIYTWSDTFWFSAVEGEVYAFSSFFTALVFWLILKWEDNADQPHSDRWLVFIAYLVGLSIGVHLLNLLCIPAIVLVYYYKMSKNPTGKGSLLVLGVSVIIVAAVLYGIVPGIVKIGGWFELLFVNTLGMPYNIGLYIYLTLLAIALVWALWETTKAKSENRMYISFIVCTALLGIPFYGHGAASVIIGIIVLGIIAGVLFFTKKATPRILNTAILCMTLMTVGYSSYATRQRMCSHWVNTWVVSNMVSVHSSLVRPTSHSQRSRIMATATLPTQLCRVHLSISARTRRMRTRRMSTSRFATSSPSNTHPTSACSSLASTATSLCTCRLTSLGWAM